MFLNINKIIGTQAFRYLVAGAFNTIFCYIIFVTFVINNFTTVCSMSFASAITLPVSYYLMSHYVFVNEASFKNFASFIMMQLGGYLINLNILVVVVWFGISVFWAGVISMLVTSVLVFIISKFLVFKKPH